MAHVLLIDNDPGTLLGYAAILRLDGHDVITASSGLRGLDVLEQTPIDVVVADLCLPDMPGLEILRWVHDTRPSTTFIVVTGHGTTESAVAAARLGARDFLEKPVLEDDLLRTVTHALGGVHDEKSDGPSMPAGTEGRDGLQAATQWACALVPILHARKDPRTIAEWSGLIAIPPGVLRQWCRMAGLSPRSSLVFGRLLRAVVLGKSGRHKPENLLDVVDRRTLESVLRAAGLNPRGEFPTDVETFLECQALVRDADTLCAVRHVLARLRTTPCRHNDN
jgi:DNA-binding NarL/FixJ family response regulator